MSTAAWIECAEIGCASGIAIDSRHVRNFEGREWLCADHEESRYPLHLSWLPRTTPTDDDKDGATA